MDLQRARKEGYFGLSNGRVRKRARKNGKRKVRERKTRNKANGNSTAPQSEKKRETILAHTNEPMISFFNFLERKIREGNDFSWGSDSVTSFSFFYTREKKFGNLGCDDIAFDSWNKKKIFDHVEIGQK